MTISKVILCGLALLAGAGCVSPGALSKSAPAELNISAVGDVLLWVKDMGSLARSMESDGKDAGAYPFAKVKGELQGIVFGNLEGPITEKPASHFKPARLKHYFAMPPLLSMASLKDAGFDIMSVANNHIKDSGNQGVSDTLAHLRQAGIVALGAGKNKKEARRMALMPGTGQKAVFLAFNLVGPSGTFAKDKQAGADTGDEEEMADAVRQAASLGHAVVVSIHWGIEQKHDFPVQRPTRHQRAVARRLIDEGASLILGHHSHAVSEFEEYRHGLICYSLGNFLFAGNGSSDRKYTVILRAGLNRNALSWYTLVPVLNDPVGTQFQPRVMQRQEGEAYLAKILFNPSSRHRPYWP